MSTHSLTVAVTLYRSGTLTLTQAARRAGLDEDGMRDALRSYGVPVREPLATPHATERPASAD
jgi:predicted HTH domain antitoxin